MKTVALGKLFGIDYAALTGSSDLYVAARIYDISSGTPVFLALVPMAHVAAGVYGGTYEAAAGKTYMAVAAVYQDSGFTTVDTGYAPRTEEYQTVGIETVFFGFDYTAYDQDSGLYVRAAVYDVSDDEDGPVFVQNVAMAHVALGTYLGTFTGELGKSYLAVKSVYADSGFNALDPLRAPAADTFGAFGTVINLVQVASLEGTPMEHLLQPTIYVTQGDVGTMELRALSDPETPFDLTGATFETKINGQNGELNVLPNSQHTILDQTDPDTKGKFLLSFTEEQSENFKWTPDGTPALEILTIVTQGESVIAFHGVNALVVSQMVPRP